jgi:hypothetical protein
MEVARRAAATARLDDAHRLADHSPAHGDATSPLSLPVSATALVPALSIVAVPLLDV